MGHRVTSVRCTSADFPFGFGGDAVTWRPGKGDAWKEHNLSGYMGNFCTCLDVHRCKKYLESNLLLYRFHQFKDRTQGPNKKHRTILGNNCVLFQVRWMTFQNDSEKNSASRLSLLSLRLLKYRQCEVPFFWERWCHLQKKFQRFVFCFCECDVWWLGFWDLIFWYFLIHEKKGMQRKSGGSFLPVARLEWFRINHWTFRFPQTEKMFWVIEDPQAICASEGWDPQLENCVQTECAMYKFDCGESNDDFFQCSEDVFIL